jgi:GDP-L-fucose synthase
MTTTSDSDRDAAAPPGTVNALAAGSSASGALAAPEEPTFVAGHRGLVGSAIVRRLADLGLQPVVRERAALDLADPAAVRACLGAVRPATLFLAAGRVGGIGENRRHPVEMAHENAVLAATVLREAFRAGVGRVIVLGSACMYPREARQPLRETSLLDGPPEPTNRAYAAAKRFAAELAWAYRVQHGSRFLTVVSTNAYGPGERLDLERGHVVPAVVRRMVKARDAGTPVVTLWGSGRPTRDFIHADDLAAACVHLAGLPDRTFATLLDADTLGCVNVGTGEETSIATLASLVAELVGFGGRIAWDTSLPDGAPRRVLDAARVRATGWAPAISLPDGLARTYAAQAAGRSEQ